MATAWDKHSATGLSRLQDALVREQVQHVVAPFSPYWKQRLAELGRTPASIDGTSALATLPAAGERDVSPLGDPAGMAALVLQTSEAGFALHSQGPTLRRALRLRATRRDAYQRLVTHDTKPTSYLWSGLGFRYLLASARGDLDVMARAGARLWKVLGLTGDDALLSAVASAPTTEHVGLQYAAMAAGAPALFPGDATPDIVAAARLAAPTVVAVESSRAPEILAALAGAGGGLLDRLHTLLLVGAPSDEQRASAAAAVAASVTVLAVHAPAGARVLWGECRQGGAATGLHTYPDLEIVQLVDPDTGDPVDAAGEIVVTQIGLRGSALLRWRTADITAGPVDTASCPGCHRSVPRVHGVRPRALVLVSDDGHTIDLRSVGGALSGRTDLADWKVVVGGRRRDGRGQVIVYFAPAGDPATVAVGAASDIRAVAGLLPTQLVAADRADITALAGDRLTPRVLVRN